MLIAGKYPRYRACYSRIHRSKPIEGGVVTNLGRTIPSPCAHRTVCKSSNAVLPTRSDTQGVADT